IRYLRSFPTRRSSDLLLPMALANVLSKPMVVPIIKKYGYKTTLIVNTLLLAILLSLFAFLSAGTPLLIILGLMVMYGIISSVQRSEEHTSELQSRENL